MSYASQFEDFTAGGREAAEWEQIGVLMDDLNDHYSREMLGIVRHVRCLALLRELYHQEPDSRAPRAADPPPADRRADENCCTSPDTALWNVHDPESLRRRIRDEEESIADYAAGAAQSEADGDATRRAALEQAVVDESRQQEAIREILNG